MDALRHKRANSTDTYHANTVEAKLQILNHVEEVVVYDSKISSPLGFFKCPPSNSAGGLVVLQGY